MPRFRPGALAAVVLVLVAMTAVAFAFAGSAATLPAGVRIAGVDVGGLTPAAAERLLAVRGRTIARTPVAIVVHGRTFRVRGADLGLGWDWSSSVAAAQEKGA